MSGYQDEKPGWGKTIGAFFLCGCLAVGACVIVSSMLARGVGFTGYSSGGITGALTGAICAAVYRSSGKLGGPAIASLVVGAVVGFIAVQMAKSAVGM